MNGSFLEFTQLNSSPHAGPLAPRSMTPPIALVLMIGIPGSGKSTWVAQFQHLQAGCVTVSTDRIREALFGNEMIQGPWCLVQQKSQQQLQQAVMQIQAGQAELAIYDATNAKRRYRRDLITLVRSIGFTHITAVWLNPSLELCLLRNQHRSRQVPEAVIRRMYCQLRGAPPRFREGIDRLFYNPLPTDLLPKM